MLIHYLEVFAAAFLVTALANADHLLDAHGLNALKSAAVALLVVAAKAGFEAMRRKAGTSLVSRLACGPSRPSRPSDPPK